jgi:hypothetical protein
MTEMGRRRLRGAVFAMSLVAGASLLAPVGGLGAPGRPLSARAAQTHSCPADLTAWQAALSAGGQEPVEWLDCHQVSDLTTTGNIYTDYGSLTGMGFPPPFSGSLNSNKTTPTSPPVPGIQLDGYFNDGCNAYQVEPASVTATGNPNNPTATPQPFIPGCTPPATTGQTCFSNCHHDGAFVIRIPDDWTGDLLSAGTPGIRDQFASDFILSDYAMEKGWAYVSQDKGNMAANFYWDGCDETGATCSGGSAWPGACTSNAQPWCAGYAIAEWTYRMRQATAAARALLDSIAADYALTGVTYSYASGISNGGYQTRRALETDKPTDQFGVLYSGGVDWEGTLFIPSLPANVTPASPTTGWILFNYLPTAVANEPADECAYTAPCPTTALTALGAVGFNPESNPLWAYHDNIYWGLTQKIYRLEFDPEYTNYTCNNTLASPCVSPPAEFVPPTDPDASYNFAARESALPALPSRIAMAANTGDIQHPMITLQGDQDALLPIETDSDLYAQMVQLAGHESEFRFYTVRGGNHVDPQFDDHNGIDSYGNQLLRPILPCARSSLDALAAWVEQGSQPPASHTIPRDPNASGTTLANSCDISAGTVSTPVPEGMPLGLISAALLAAGAGARLVRRSATHVD